MDIDRSKIIGGSDIAAVMGLSRWKTPLALWAEKTGKVKQSPTPEQEEAMAIGTEFEDYIARRFSKKTGLQVRRKQEEYRHPKYPYLVGHIDRLVLDGASILECKFTSGWQVRRDDEIPIEYVLQVNWYLGLSQRKKGWLAMLIGTKRFEYKEIAFDQRVYEDQVARAVHFWEEFVLKDIPPVAQAEDTELLEALFPMQNEKVVYVTDTQAKELNDLVEKRQSLLDDIEKKKKEADEISNRIKQAIGENAGLATDRFKVTWRPMTRSVADIEKLKADGLADKYLKTVDFRMLKVVNYNK